MFSDRTLIPATRMFIVRMHAGLPVACTDTVDWDPAREERGAFLARVAGTFGLKAADYGETWFALQGETADRARARAWSLWKTSRNPRSGNDKVEVYTLITIPRAECEKAARRCSARVFAALQMEM